VRLRTITIALVVALFASIGAASALAGPQVGRCVSQPGTGKYKDANCTMKAGSKPEEKSFEFLKNAVHKGFTLAGGVSSFIGVTSGEQVFCGNESGSGEYLESGSIPSTKQVHHVESTLTGCELENRHGGPDAICETPGQGSGTIVLATLAGKMGVWLEESLPLFGQELHPESKKAAYTTIECPSAGMTFAFAAGRCVITVLNPKNLMDQIFGWNYEQQVGPGPGEQSQVPEHFVNSSHVCHLEWSINGGPLEKVIRHGGDTVKNEEELEIKG
jgi:hypothetical protein